MVPRIIFTKAESSFELLQVNFPSNKFYNQINMDKWIDIFVVFI